MARPICKTPEQLLTILSTNWQPIRMVAADLFRDDREAAGRMLLAIQSKLGIGIQYQGEGRKSEVRIAPADWSRAKVLAEQWYSDLEAA